jgi:hypothetical protein
MILGISGRKQAGKNTTANIFHGIVLKKQGLIKDWNIDALGHLNILTENNNGKEGWGYFDITRRDSDFVEYAEHNMWPHVKLYSFADNLKSICTELFNIPHECVYGTDEQKNQKQEHLLWENMPTTFPISHGPMTAREFMQFLGTDVMRKIYEPVWVQSCIKKIKREQSELAIIADVRFPNEAKAIENAGGKVIRLTRKVHNDNHSSEVALDDYPFTDYIDNEKESIDDLMVKVKKFYNHLKGV